MENLISIVREAQGRDYDATIAMSGFPGAGKSTFSLQLLKLYYGIKTGDLESLDKHLKKYMVFTRSDLGAHALQLTHKCLIADEAINVLFRRDFAVGKQKALLKVLDMCRDNNHLFIFNIPSFWMLDGHTLQTRIRLWLHIENQSMAHFFMPIRNPFTTDVWMREWNGKIFTRTGSFVNSPNYIGTIKFGPLPRDEYQLYKGIKKVKRLETDEDEKKEDMNVRDLARLIKKVNPKAEGTAIAKALGVTPVYIYQIFQRFRREKGEEPGEVKVEK